MVDRLVDPFDEHGIAPFEAGPRNKGIIVGRRVKGAVVAERGKVYRVTEVVGTSDASIQEAVRNAIKRANETLRNLDWFQVGEVRGTIDNGDVGEFQVAVKIGFRLD